MAPVVFHLLWERGGGKPLASNKAFFLVGHVLFLSISLGTGLICSHSWVGVVSVSREWVMCHQRPASRIPFVAARLVLPKCLCGCPSGDEQEEVTRSFYPSMLVL